ncbi:MULTISPECIES: host specificity protein J [unclassified Pseudomonas]|uniref:host specificity protein J n=1 Tax=unclassified Pseudomonas TaxID=196821 RepID=UPI000C86E33F|nr:MULTISPECIES: phage tail protein [unclassified Pseudomonas]PMV79608.1 host specificity protein [Pseudomonas sp. GW101-1A09]PMV86863.1 host specificity protein [Pseudomonas sp. FW306-2-2C-B10A]PMV98341.1 host specificity protein [Pseudomonas sp. GW460-C8]PMV98988.1 host specificity protein [Pseudomonas sp. MPR-TSA4]PMW07036.1 host specificity protein [Pseudomonas sp. FW306-2-1A-C05A]
MGAALKNDIHGEKGGSSKPKSPTEASDSLRSTNLAKILIAVGEGEFDEVPTDYSIFLDNTPIRDASGNYNFPNVKWDWRPGSVDQTYIPGIPSVENETSLNVELRSDAPWVRSISNTQLSAARIRLAWPALQRQDDEGNVVGYRIEYAIDVATDGGAYQQVAVDAVDGKTTTRYERSVRVDLPDATSGWQIRVRRLTPNQNSNKIADTMLIAGYTEVIDAKLRYPNTALLYIEFDAEQFTNIPAVTVRCRARRWMVPSNYDPIARTYTGTWDGSMKSAWTNNAAWITYGVCTEDRFGLGKRIKPFMVDKWELYRIAQYCDQLVPNGLGGVEPRFLCDMNLQGKADAWSLLRDIAGIYRGMTYWAQGQLVMQADMPRAQDFDYVFTRANVIDGKFSYGSASAKTRYTRALVSYDNPANNYDTDVIPFADLDLQRRYGDRPTELSAIGCTRASEAQRRGKWAILSNNQDRTVSFKTGMEGVIPLPGHIIPVADSLLAGREVGGRISVAAGRVVTLDRDTQAKAGDRLIINLPGGRAEGRTVQSVNGRAVTVTTNYSEPPLPQLQWALDADDLAIPLYRVLRTKRTTEGDFEISALQYDPSKFAYIDTGARLEERPISVIPITVVPAPASVTVTSNSVVSQGIAVATMTITWPAVNGSVGYDVEWRKDSGNWIKLQRTGMTSVDVVGIYAGAYVARVRAVSAFDISSIWRASILTNLKGKEGLPPAVSFLTATPLLFGIYLKWGFPAGAEDTQRTEIWYGPTTSLEAATKLTDLSYPQSDFSMLGLRAGVTFFFWARLVDRIGNIGPWYPIGIGVMGQSSADAAAILEMIAGQIGETELGQDLLDQINKIPGLQDQIDALDGLSAYKPDQVYEKDQMVVADGKIFQSKGEVPINTPPPNATYWLDVGESIETANGLAQQVAFNTADITELDGVVTAQATAFQALRASYRDDNGEGDLADAMKGWTSTAAIASESKVRSSENEAFAQRITTFDAKIGENAANITELEQVVATNQSATATKIDQLSVTVGQNGTAIQQNSAAIQQTSTAYADTAGKLSTMWSVKMQITAGGQYVAAGIGLGIENTGAGLQSQFLVSADRFAIVNTIAGGAISVPFAVQGGQVFMNSAFIENGSINMLKIGDNLQSDNYIAGTTGWRLTKAGVFEINGNVAGAGRMTMTNSALKVYDANGVKRVQLGDLNA